MSQRLICEILLSKFGCNCEKEGKTGKSRILKKSLLSICNWKLGLPSSQYYMNFPKNALKTQSVVFAIYAYCWMRSYCASIFDQGFLETHPTYLDKCGHFPTNHLMSTKFLNAPLTYKYYVCTSNWMYSYIQIKPHNCMFSILSANFHEGVGQGKSATTPLCF